MIKTTITMFTRKSTKIGAIVFDAQVSTSLTASSTITEYPTELGKNVSHNVIQNPTTLSIEVGMGTSKLMSIGGAVTGVLSGPIGAVSSGLGKFAGFMGMMFSPNDGRGGSVLSDLLLYKEGGNVLDIDLPRVGIIKNMVVTNITHNRNVQYGDGDMFTVTLTQVRFSSTGGQAQKVGLESDKIGDKLKSKGKAATDKVTGLGNDFVDNITGGFRG